MCSKLNDYQFKKSRYSYWFMYTNVITTNPTPAIKNMQKPERKEYKHNTKENHQLKKKRPKVGGKQENYENNQETNNKMPIRACPSSITLNVNGLNVLIKRHEVADWIKNPTQEFPSWLSGNESAWHP